MKHYKYLLLVIATLTSAILGCKKSFLDEVNSKDALFTQDYIVDLKATGEYLNGVYTQLGGGLFSGTNVIYSELIADNLKPSTSGLINFYNWNQQANETAANFSPLSSRDMNCNNISYTAYKIIRACNYVLEKADQYKSQNPEKANAMIGEAYTIRALVHFILVNIFAQSYNFTEDGSHPGVVYITSSNWTNPVKGRNTVSEVYTNLISDLKNAISLLPPNTISRITISKNTSIALLARVYLFKGDWVSAKNLARQVATAVPVMTLNYPAKLFSAEETEALFQLPPGSDTEYVTKFASGFFRGSAGIVATADIAALLNEDPGDVRRSWITQVSNKWNIVKFPFNLIPNPGSFNPNDAYCHTVIRSSEMYLTAAEAYAQLNMTDSARFYLDAIRKRANPTVAVTNATGGTLLEAIYKERRKELAFEGLRMFDLLRWKKGVNRGDALSATAQTLPYPSNKAIAPIPGLDVKLSHLAQNEGY